MSKKGKKKNKITTESYNYETYYVAYYHNKSDYNGFSNATFLKNVQSINTDNHIEKVNYEKTNNLYEAHKFNLKEKQDWELLSYLIRMLFDTEFLFDFLQKKDKVMVIQSITEIPSDEKMLRVTGDGKQYFLDFIDGKRTIVCKDMWHSDLHNRNKKVHYYNTDNGIEIKDYVFTGMPDMDDLETVLIHKGDLDFNVRVREN